MIRAGRHIEKWPGCVSAMIAAAVALAPFAFPGARAAPDFEVEAVLLAATPNVRHPIWGHAVLLAAPLPVGGHVGVILNKPTRYTLSNLFPEHGPSKRVTGPVYFGGPYGSGSIVALSSLNGAAPPKGAMRLGEQLYLVYAANEVDRIIEQRPNDARYFAGFVVWQPGELLSELDAGLWTLHQADTTTVFRVDTERLWPELSGAAGRMSTLLELDELVLHGEPHQSRQHFALASAQALERVVIVGLAGQPRQQCARQFQAEVPAAGA